METFTKKEAKEKIGALVRQFDDDLVELRATAHSKEAHVEDTYIKPFFRYLNWNVTNEGLPLARHEFIVQATQQVGRSLGEPDYLLRLPEETTGQMKSWLFMEAKHPRYDLSTNLRWMRQAYLYAHSTLNRWDSPENHVRLAILTDFAKFRLFDCTDPFPLTRNDPDLFAKRPPQGCGILQAVGRGSCQPGIARCTWACSTHL